MKQRCSLHTYPGTILFTGMNRVRSRLGYRTADSHEYALPGSIVLFHDGAWDVVVFPCLLV